VVEPSLLAVAAVALADVPLLLLIMLLSLLLIVLPFLRKSLRALARSALQLLAVVPERKFDESDALPVVCAPTTVAAANADTRSNALGLKLVCSYFILPPSFLMRRKPSSRTVNQYGWRQALRKSANAHFVVR